MNEFKKTVSSDSFWIRTLFVVLYFVLYRVLDIVLLLTTLGQWLFTLFTGKPHSALTHFGYSLGVYLQQIAHYLSAVTDDKPYPFQDWPKSDKD